MCCLYCKVLEWSFYLLTKTEKRWLNSMPGPDLLPLFYYFSIKTFQWIACFTLRIGYNFFFPLKSLLVCKSWGMKFATVSSLSKPLSILSFPSLYLTPIFFFFFEVYYLQPLLISEFSNHLYRLGNSFPISVDSNAILAAVYCKYFTKP